MNSAFRFEPPHDNSRLVGKPEVIAPSNLQDYFRIARDPDIIRLFGPSSDSTLHQGCGTPGGYGPFETSQNVQWPCSAAWCSSSGGCGVKGSPGWTLRARRYSSKPGRENRAER